VRLLQSNNLSLPAPGGIVTHVGFVQLSKSLAQESENGSFMFWSFSQVLVPYLCRIKKVLSNYEKAQILNYDNASNSISHNLER